MEPALAVFLNGQQLKMRAAETEQQHVMDGGRGNKDLSMNWDLQYPELGNTVEIITQYMRVVVWLNHESFLEDVSTCLWHPKGSLCAHLQTRKFPPMIHKMRECHPDTSTCTCEISASMHGQ